MAAHADVGAAIEDQRLLGVIRDSYVASSGVYGARRVIGDLREAGETCGKHRVAKIMRTHKIKTILGYKAPCHIVGSPSIVAPNPPRTKGHRRCAGQGVGR
jgi:putative transposase